MLLAQAAFCLLGGVATPVPAQPTAEELDDTAVVTVTGVIVKAPGRPYDQREAIGIDAETVRGSGTPNLFRALGRSVPGLSFQDAQNNPFQPNLVYRGFTVSPLQGQPQGLAMYVDGARFNQFFGDTVQFDLLPEAAIDRIDILTANPVYGLNALGGAIAVATKTGRSAPGIFLSGAAGAYGEAEAVAEAGWAGERSSAYLALQRSHDGGWRRFSPSRLHNGFADFGWDGEQGGAHLKLIGADSDLIGNGSAPVELLEADYRAVFTHPDNTRNRYGRASLHPWLALGGATRLEATLYSQTFRQWTLNGDAADIEACDSDAEAGLLCLESADEQDAAVLRDRNEAAIADALGGEGYGVLNRSQTRTTAAGALVQLVDRRPVGPGENELALGFSYDRSRTGFESSSELGALTETRSVEGLGPVIAQPDGAIAPVSLAGHTRYTGIFVSEKLSGDAGLTVELGLRWNHARVILDDRIGTALDGSHRFHRLNPGMKLGWQVTPATSVGIGYSEANRAPTPAELACADEQAPCSLTNFFVADPPLKQVVARSFEAVGRGTIAGVEWRASVYRTNNQDDIQFVASDTRGRAFFRNIGSTRRQGLEAMAGYGAGALSVRAGYAFTDATFGTPLLLNAPDNPQAGDDGRISVRRGDRLPGVPRHRALLSLDYDSERLSLGGDVQAASGQYLFGDEANFERPTASYVIANVRGAIRIGRALTLFAEVQNVFDKRYATFGTFGAADEVELEEVPGASDPRSLGPGAPRRWLVGLRASF
jgi:iron complex outermembrane receptor protein